MLANFFFYFFAILTVLFASLVVTFRNTMHSVLALILTFFSCAGLFLLADAEFLAMVMVTVYVGAVAVLFLFVVMTVGADFDQPRLRQQTLPYMLLAGSVGLGFAGIFYLLMQRSTESLNEVFLWRAVRGSQNGIYAIGEVLYTHYIVAFQVMGLILFVGMMGAVLLTLRHREEIKRQNPSLQSQRRSDESLQLVNVPLRKGISWTSDSHTI